MTNITYLFADDTFKTSPRGDPDLKYNGIC